MTFFQLDDYSKKLGEAESENKKLTEQIEEMKTEIYLLKMELAQVRILSKYTQVVSLGSIPNIGTPNSGCRASSDYNRASGAHHRVAIGN